MSFHNPEGMSDIIGAKCSIKKNKEEKIRKLFNSYGFMEIETPCLEYFDMYYGENEYVSQQDIFKLVDKTGSLLVLRPDMTVPACRVAATKIKYETLPYKLSYISKCFRADEFGGGKQREFTQCGVEVLGGSNPYYDALVIKLAISTAKEMGIKDISIQIGQVEFFNGLAESAGLSDKECDVISKRIDSKDSYGILECLEGKCIDEDVLNHITSITGYFGNVTLLDELMQLKLNSRSMAALDNLKNILDIIDQMGLSQYVTVDLSMVKKLGYYTGMIFNGNTFQMGFPILAGGRYDNLAIRMGRQLNATGFSLSLEMAMMATDRQGILEEPLNDRVVLSFSIDTRKEVLSMSNIVKENMSIEILPDSEDLEKYIEERNISTLVKCIDKDNVIVIKDGISTQMTMSQWRKLWNI